MHFVSDFADEAVILPLAGIVALVLGVMGWWRGMSAWLAATGLTFGLVLLTKIAGVAFADTLGQSSVSGHVAAACVVYGGLAVLVCRRAVSPVVLAALALLIACGVGYTRVELLAHDWAEVVVGGVIGAIGLGVLPVIAGPSPRLSWWPMLTAVTCTILALHGTHLTAEAVIRTNFSAL